MTTSTMQPAENDLDMAHAIRHLSSIPPWLAAALDTNQVMAALNVYVPEFASGALQLRKCVIDQLHLKGTKGEWERNWKLSVADANGERSIPIRVTLIAPGLSAVDPPATVMPIESDDWQCWLPELGLLCKRGRSKKSKDFPSLQVLTDGVQAGRLLEQALRAQATGYEHMSIYACSPEIVHNKPGKSTVIRYRLDYGQDSAGRGWRDSVILKVYGDDTGRNAYLGMRAVWQAGLHASMVVRIPEPLAYLDKHYATLQGPVPEEHDLEKLLGALLSDNPADQAALHQAVRATGVALAALHRCGAVVTQVARWGDVITEAEDQLMSLHVPFPEAISVIDQLVERLRTLEAATPADSLVPTHGAFRPEQVLVASGQIGFIDFDSFCMAEPAYDLALFRASMMDNGLYDEHIQIRDDAEVLKRQTRLDVLNESFLAGYEAHAPVSRQRVALWEAIFYLNDSLQCWSKPRPNDARLVVGLLERHMQALGIIAPGAGFSSPLAESSTVVNLRRLGVLPAWLLAPLQAEVVAEALRQAVPELADGHIALKACKIKRMLLKDDARWVGTYTLKLDDPASGKRELSLRGTLTPPHLRSATPAAPAAPQVALGAEGWHCTLPALGLVLVPEPPEHELAAMPQLTDPDASRAMLEQGMRTTPGYHDITIEVCTPEVLSYKPGSRCTLRYHLHYPPAPTDRGWPSTVIAKTYRKDSKGRNAYEGMSALWNTPLARGEVVALAEPLAYIPEHKVLVQGPVAGTQSLEDLLKAALAADTAAAYAELSGYMIRTAAGLAALHSSGVYHGELVTLDERWAELHDLSARLYAAVPDLTGAADTLQAQLEALAAATPAGAPVPTHGTFNPEQVMIDGPHIGFIDFDDFCMAEPALDVGLFLAAINDTGLNALDDQQARDPATRRARLARLAAIGEVFLAFYEKLAPLDRKRVALWQAWSCLRDTLHFWIKAKPAEPDNGLLMLLDTLQTIGVIPPADPAAATATVQQARRRLAIPAARYAAYASALLAGAGVSLNDLAELLGEVLPLIG